ncbi:MAG: HTH-type transcriptional regulator YodB [Candidatus Heimdallarchaeota archaeon LC_3]|nr:MAG: HTH-type transcriptional regulator YodB [Candidatus Heimdallarchaeota archaeon LC_3]
MAKGHLFRENIRSIVESNLENFLEGINKFVIDNLEEQPLEMTELKTTIQSLEGSFDLLSQRWNLQILYSLFFKERLNFNVFKKVLGINSRTLSTKLKNLASNNYLERNVTDGPPISVEYSLTERGRDTVLLALPLLYNFLSYKEKE